jgi:Spy/CpxP family protein refolding chaperone
MKSNRNLLAGSLLAAAALLAAATSISVATAADEATTAAPPAPGPHAWHHHHGAGQFLAKLNLSAEQQASVKTIMANAGPQMKSIHQEMRANSLKLRQTQPNDPNYANVVAQVTQGGGARAGVQGADAGAADSAGGPAGADAFADGGADAGSDAISSGHAGGAINCRRNRFRIVAAATLIVGWRRSRPFRAARSRCRGRPSVPYPRSPSSPCHH